MYYTERYIKLRDEVWKEFERTVKQGTMLSIPILVTYPREVIVKDLLKTTDGLSCFDAKAIVANPNYVLHVGIDLIVATGKVTFIDLRDIHHYLEPDILDLDWLCELLDNRKHYSIG